MQPFSKYSLVNLSLVFAYLLQDCFAWKIDWLETRQTLEDFKQGTGILLFVFLLCQNLLFLVRDRSQWKRFQTLFYTWHVRSSLLSIPLLYLHSTRVGFHYLALLSGVFVLNVVVGSFSPKHSGIQDKRYVAAWTLIHVGFSCFVFFFVFYHIFMTFYFN